MIVFKSYLKIINRKKLSILMTFFIVIALSLFTLNQDNDDGSTKQVSKGIKIAVINKNKSLKNDELVKYLSSTMNMKEIKDDEIAIKDALISSAIEYVLIMNKDGYNSYQVPNSKSGYIAKGYVNSYLNTFSSYKRANYSDKKAASKTIDTLSNEAKLEKVNYDKNELKVKQMNTFFKFYVYGYVGVVISGICLVMLAFNKQEVFKRTIVSKFSLRKRNIILYIAHSMFGIVSWLLFSLVSIIMFPDLSFGSIHKMYLLNSFVFIFPVTAFALIIGQLVKSTSSITPINNILTVGLSFISGTFIPLEFLNDTIIKIATFSPTYWFVLNNEKIKGLNKFTLVDILNPIAIQMGFAIVFIIIALIVSKQKVQIKK